MWNEWVIWLTGAAFPPADGAFGPGLGPKTAPLSAIYD